MSEIDVKEVQRLMGMLRSIDVGLIVLDENFTIKVWNDFMTNHSGIRGEHVVGTNLFDRFNGLPEDWLRNKTRSVFQLNNSAFTTWEQRPYLFKFKNYRPITGTADFMYQNITFLPLSSADGTVDHIGIIIYDVTDVAVGRVALEKANEKIEELRERLL
ncbi:diguanylate cyclase (GGDEF domain) with PAS/PAC sensor [hydrothermal vent metagenome]|uniref:Diguanylate cyclase (GGDEF domain) with PAS/PAC sensor n=1 Tax=hydrothermal vent metagenome TaxID=652676 RepID=A0A3B1A3H7_9ZZZZ